MYFYVCRVDGTRPNHSAHTAAHSTQINEMACRVRSIKKSVNGMEISSSLIVFDGLCDSFRLHELMKIESFEKDFRKHFDVLNRWVEEKERTNKK